MKRSALVSPEETGFLLLSENIVYSDAGITSRTIVAAGGTRVTLFAFAAGQELTEHTSGSRALVVALEGLGHFRAGGRSFEMRAGDFLHLPPGAPHAVEARERFAMLLVLQKPDSSAAAEMPGD